MRLENTNFVFGFSDWGKKVASKKVEERDGKKMLSFDPDFCQVCFFFPPPNVFKFQPSRYTTEITKEIESAIDV